MPTLFSKWNGKSLKPATTSRYGQGISSSDLHAGAEDAKQLKNVPDVAQVTKKKKVPQPASEAVPAPALKSDPYTLPSPSPSQSQAHGPDISAWRVVASQQLLPNPLSEFGAGTLSQPVQRASTTKPTRSRNESRALYSSSTLGAHPSTKQSARKTSLNDSATAVSQPPSYGYTTFGWDTQMDVTRATEIVLACGQQIRARGLDSPLIFSSMALDLSSHSITSLLQSLVKSPSLFLSSDVKFANAHDLAAVIKWTLARLGKVVPGTLSSQDHTRKGDTHLEETVLVQQRGILEWDSYARWAAQERTNGYPLAAFASFLESMSSSSLALLVAVFSLLSSTTSYSHKNGMTPSRLSRLFGVLLFGLPEDDTFERTYEAFVRAGNATEHLLLSYIRDCSTTEAIPTRLADHVKGYPAMLSTDISQSSRSVQGIPMTHVNRTVRLYSLDLIQTACEMDVAQQSLEWKACCSTSDSIGKDPQLSDRFRKLINLRGGKKQGRGQKDPEGSPELEAYGSLVDKKWGDFMNEGFAAPDQSKLAFDLKESERKARRQRPDSVQWSQFEESGFVKADDGLASVLSFDDGLRDDMERWPAERAELMEKLRKTNKKMPPFAYDTTPYIVSSPTLDKTPMGQWQSKPVSRIDEVFAEVFADILLGNGWMNRDEQTHRNANFVLVQYKSRPTSSTVGSQSAGSSRQTRGYIAEPDDRTSAAWFVVEEIVPAQYRSEMEASGTVKGRTRASLRKLNIFKKRKDDSHLKGAEAAATSSSFDELFRPGLGGVTKKVQLNKDPASTTAAPLSRKDSGSTVRQRTIGDADSITGGSKGGSKLMTTFLNNTTLRSKSIKTRKGPQAEEEMPPAPPPKPTLAHSPSFTSDDFETRSLHDPESDAFAQDRSGKHSLLRGNKNAKRMSKDDNWLDVMIRANGFRMAGQDATKAGPPATAPAPPPATATAPAEEVDEFLTPTGSETNVAAPSRAAEALPEASPHPNDSPRSISAIKQKMAQEDDAVSMVSQKSFRAAGWTMDGEPSTVLPATPPKRNRDAAAAVTPPTAVQPSPLMQPVSSSTGTADIPETIPEAEPSLPYLQPLPPKTADLDEREKARDVRIQAAKNRAKELRANLNPVAVQELEDRREAKGKTTSAYSTPMGAYAETRETQSPSSSPTPLFISQRKASLQDDPFSKDRFSGRVASVANKFGGGVAPGGKPITPQSTGSSVAPISPSPGSSAFHNATHDKRLPSVTADYLEESSSHRSAEYSMGDVDSIYPEDAASNFSRDTNPDDEVNIRNVSSVRPGGSIAASTSPLISSAVDKHRLEEEDSATSAMPSFRQPYQPGMPLSNLEEESESVLSGSNH